MKDQTLFIGSLTVKVTSLLGIFLLVNSDGRWTQKLDGRRTTVRFVSLTTAMDVKTFRLSSIVHRPSSRFPHHSNLPIAFMSRAAAS
jgi:hypothetical protein